MFNFLKKKEDSPPDVGKEATDVVTEVNPDDVPVEDSPMEEVSPKNLDNIKKSRVNSANAIDETTRFEIEKINARLEAVNEFMKGFNERFSMMNQQLGEVRAMSISNEKEISKSTLEAQKAVDIVKEVKPEEIRIDYQKMDLRANSLLEKIDSNKQFMDSIMEELKELKRKAGLFEGTDSLLKLNSDVKKDLIELQKMADRVRMNADKSEQIFVELRKGFTENQKSIESIENFNIALSETKKELEKLKIDHSEVLKDTDFNNFRKLVQNKMYLLESYLSQITELKNNNERLTKFIEDILYLEKRNERDIGDIGLNVGKNSVKRVSEYDERLMSVLILMDKIASEINDIKVKVGMRKPTEKEMVIVPQNNLNTAPKNNFMNYYKEEPDISQNMERISKELASEGIKTEFKTEAVKTPESKPEAIKIPELEKDIQNKSVSEQIIPLKNASDMPVISSKVIDIQESNNVGNKQVIKNFSNNHFRDKKNDHDQRINDLLLKGGEYLVNKDFINSIRAYKEVLKIYNPKLDKNKSIYNRMIRFYENILKLSKNFSIEPPFIDSKLK